MSAARGDPHGHLGRLGQVEDGEWLMLARPDGNSHGIRIELGMDWEKVRDRLANIGEGVGKGFKNVFGSRNERVVKSLAPTIAEINELEPWAKSLDREAMQAEILRMKAQVMGGEVELDDCLTRSFALTRESAVRTLGMRHFDVQLVGGYVLHNRSIAEMMTGEGKTLVATLPMVLNSLTGRPVYLVTVNDYLARRDAAWMSPILEYLGLKVGSIQSSMSPWDRKPLYECDVVYGTNNEFGFDYLRDNMKTTLDQQVQKDLYFAIIDEVDSVLVDEARTPLIISGPAEEHIGKYQVAHQIAQQLVRDEHYEVKEKERAASLLEDGILAAQEIAGVESFYLPGFEDWPHYIENALRAKELYFNDKEYVVEEGEVIIVDEFTGRKMNGRRWSDGLHQAVEVKEGLEPKSETQTLATITFQNYFRMFEKLAGMTGTAITEAGEFHKIYDLDVVSIPTNLPIARLDANDVVYRTEPEKWRAIVREIARVHEKGQPVLVGTASVENSEKVSQYLHKCWCEEVEGEHVRGKGDCVHPAIPHEILNAKNHAREAQIIAKAGERGAVTIATNMAGRGTDIKLGGNFEYRLETALEAAGLRLGDVERLEEIDSIREVVREQCRRDELEVMGFGGLYVLGTERHEARRIDNQLRGRSGRQGNSGESRFFLSLQDPLMRIFYRDWVTNAMERMGMTEDQEIESGMVTRAIGRAQKKVEERNFEIRKSLLEYDEVMDQQRKTIYSVRQEVLEGQGLEERVAEMLAASLRRSAGNYSDDANGLKEWCLTRFGFEVDDERALEQAVLKADPDFGPLTDIVLKRYEERREEFGEELSKRVASYLLLNSIDGKWKDHLHAIDALKAGIGLRGYGQVDPKIEYKREGSDLFHNHLFPAIEDEVASLILRIQVQRPQAAAAEVEGQEASGESAGGGLTPRGIAGGSTEGQGGGVAARPSAAQIQAYKRQVMAAQARQAMQPRVAASNAFDLMKRRQAAAAQQEAASETATEPEVQPQAEPEAAAAPSEAFAGAGRNDPCPCGSGKKYKKCHGAT